MELPGAEYRNAECGVRSAEWGQREEDPVVRGFRGIGMVRDVNGARAGWLGASARIRFQPGRCLGHYRAWLAGQRRWLRFRGALEPKSPANLRAAARFGRGCRNRIRCRRTVLGGRVCLAKDG